VKPVCVKCQRFFRPKKTGFYFVEGMPKVNNAAPGTSEPEKWGPYKLWVGDLWVCHGCGREIVSGVAGSPIAEHYQPDFEGQRAAHAANLQVNDC
jgi:hypothetical protein